MSNVVILASKREEIGIQTGMNATFRTLGQSLGPVVGSTIFSAITVVRVIPVAIPNGPTLALPEPIPAITGFLWVYLLIAVLGATSFVLSLALRNYRFLADGSRVDVGTPDAAPRAVAVAGVAPTPTPTTRSAE
ncbi:MAG TPA: hypothetical protein VGU43_04315, partial [Thermoplasmata archaeon]|nr:hypothetical protein [Thermoplasmata archaeon]